MSQVTMSRTDLEKMILKSVQDSLKAGNSMPLTDMDRFLRNELPRTYDLPKTYKFWNEIVGDEKGFQRGVGGFDNLGEFAQTITRNQADGRLKRVSKDPDDFLVDAMAKTVRTVTKDEAMTVGDSEYGGFAVPDEVAAGIWDTMIRESQFTPLVTTYPMKTATRRVPRFSDYDHSSGKTANLALQWMAEAGTGVKQAFKLERLLLSAKKGGIFIRASNELTEDARDFSATVEKAFSGALRFGLDWCILNGTGAGQPLGLLNAPCRIAVDAEIGQKAKTVVWENCVKQFARMYPPYRRRAVWIANDDTIPQLQGMSVAVGTGGTWIPAMKEANGEFYIMGRPVIFTELCQTLGTEGDLIFAHMPSYAWGVRSEMALQHSEHFYFDTDESLWRLIVRVDGMPEWSQPLTPRYSSDTLSPVVTLQTRA